MQFFMEILIFLLDFSGCTVQCKVSLPDITIYIKRVYEKNNNLILYRISIIYSNFRECFYDTPVLLNTCHDINFPHT